MIYRGDGVRLKVHFKTFTNIPVDPTNITLTIYDETETQIEQFLLDDTNREDVGVYFYDYVADDNIVFEFKGTYNSMPIIVRDSLQTKFN